MDTRFLYIIVCFNFFPPLVTGISTTWKTLFASFLLCRIVFALHHDAIFLLLCFLMDIVAKTVTPFKEMVFWCIPPSWKGRTLLAVHPLWRGISAKKTRRLASDQLNWSHSSLIVCSSFAFLIKGISYWVPKSPCDLGPPLLHDVDASLVIVSSEFREYNCGFHWFHYQKANGIDEHLNCHCIQFPTVSKAE